MRFPFFLRPALVAAAVALIAAAVAACGGDDPTPTSPLETTPTPAAAPPVEQGSGSLVIYSGRGESLVDPIIQQFADVTGIDVQVKYGGTASLAATLLEEGANSPADVFYAQDPGGLGAVESLLAPLPADILERSPEWARSPQGLWAGVSGRARVLVYSPDRVPESELPADIFDLIQPQWKGRVGWAPHERLLPHHGHRHAHDLG